MGKDISTLVEDIYDVAQGKTDIPPEAFTELGGRISASLSGAFRQREARTHLRLSNLGSPCDRKLWYSINQPDGAEELSGPAKIKFAFGHILEELVLWLAEQAGHRVEGRQTELTINGVLGHRDAVIDGHLVDVKSASPYAFRKFENHDLPGNDSFGYLTQIGAYLDASQTDDTVTSKTSASFLAIEKVLGKITLDTYDFPKYNYNKVVDEKRAMLARPVPPPRGHKDVADGKSGNRRLDVACSYCEFKHKCWPGLRTFAYSTGPAFLTYVAREPKVAEFIG